jgi:soluble lytic murein transglycosylase
MDAQLAINECQPGLAAEFANVSADQHLRELLDKNKGNHVLATASYNAGPHRIKRWLRNEKNMPADVWIETIPFKETRNYVKSVLAYQEIYQHKPGQVSAIFNQIIDMQIGNQ